MIIGAGRVGLVTSGCLAATGHDIVCADRNAELIGSLERGDLPIYEPHLNQIVQESVGQGRLRFSSDVSRAANDTDVVFLCVGVHQTRNGDYDFSALDSAVRSVAKADRPPILVVERNTVPVETGKQLKHLLSVYNRTRAKFFVAANPQFSRQGSAVDDFLHPERILLGIEDANSENILRQIYAPLLDKRFDCPVHSHSCPPGKRPELVLP